MSFEWIDQRRFRQDPRDPLFYQNPYAVYRLLHERGGPVFWEDYGLWCLTEFEAVDKCLRDRRFARLPPRGHTRKPYPSHLADFAAAEAYSLLALEPPQHTRLRKLVNRAFVSRQVEKMADDIDRLAHQCIDRFEGDGRAELLAQYATPIPAIVIARLLGVPEAETDDLLRWSHAMVKVYTLTQTLDDEHAANTAAAEFVQRLRDLIKDKRKQPAHDLLSHLIEQQYSDDGPTDDEIVSIAILLLNAGHEATVHQLGNSIVKLLHTTSLPPGWYRDTAATDSIVAECLRYDAPLHLFTRYAQESVTLAEDVIVEAGTEIALLLGAANRCPVQFVEAGVFTPGRPDADYVSLGAGIHFCVGAPLARLELRIALAVLFQRLPGMRLRGNPDYRDSFHFHGMEAVHVVW
jgi:unspecific monooxygenase